jgi:hypothetical protein
MTISITLHHCDVGRLSVRLCEDATWRNRRRTWVCDDDTELGEFYDLAFEEAPATIDRLLLAARNEKISKEGVGHNAKPAPLPGMVGSW